jgi:hypothetical protein
MDSEHVVERGVVLVVIVGRRHLAASGEEIGDITGLLFVCDYSQSVLLEGDGKLHHLRDCGSKHRCSCPRHHVS